MAAFESREIELENRRIAYTLRRSDRARWLRAELGLRTGLRVTLPAGMDEATVAPFLLARRRWILRVLKRFERLASIVPDRTLAHGTTVPFLGRALTLDLSLGEPRVGRLGDSLIVHVRRRARGAVAAALQAWYRSEAARELGGWARDLGSRHGLSFRKIVIGDQKSRWGTCYRNGTLSFNWRLLLAPEAVARYLVAHELSHVAEPNHSARFWAKVGDLCPAWRDQESWLRKYGAALVL
jgi:predicted metal-dependent hydrolase